MLNLTILDIIQLGTTGIAIIVIFLVIQKFLEFLKIQENNFSEVIKNHLKHSTDAQNKLERTNDKLTVMIEALLRYLRKNGH